MIGLRLRTTNPAAQRNHRHPPRNTSTCTSPRPTATRLDSAAALAFLGIALLGLVLGTAFFHNLIATPEEARFCLGSGGLLPVSNLAIGIKVASSLFLVFAVLARWHAAAETKPEPKQEEGA